MYKCYNLLFETINGIFESIYFWVLIISFGFSLAKLNFMFRDFCFISSIFDL
jgi:hypothetical protein